LSDLVPSGSRAGGGLPLGRTLVAAALTLAGRRRAVLHALALPATVLFAHSVLEALRPELAAALAFGVMVLLVPLQILLAVNVQRLTLIGAEAVPALGLGSWGLREWRYLGWCWLQWIGAAIAMLVLAPLSTFGAPGWAVIFGVGAWVAGRLALMLPGIAVDRPLAFRDGWRIGQGAGVRLAVLAVGVPVAGFLLLYPLGAAELLPVRLFGSAMSLLVNCWYTAALALAWQTLLRDDAAPAGAATALATDPARAAVRIEADALRGVLRIHLPRDLAEGALVALGEEDELAPYAGRLRGLVVELGDAFEDADPMAVDAQLDRLEALRVHGGHLQRVALLAPTAWAPVAEAWGERFDGAAVRWFPPLRGARAVAWASGEDPD
jgi:hypothetical protein